MHDPENALTVKPYEPGHASCNVCYASNYNSMLAPVYGQIDRLWEVQIGGMVLCLCDNCLEKLKAKITEALEPDFEDEAETAKAAYERLYEHTQHFIPVDDLWALDAATDALQKLYNFEEEAE